MYNQYDIVLKFVRLYEYTQAAVSNRSRDRKVCETITAIGCFPFCKNPFAGVVVSRLWDWAELWLNVVFFRKGGIKN